MSNRVSLNRRDFLRLSSLATAGVAAACATGVPGAPAAVEEVAEVAASPRQAEFTMGVIPHETAGTFYQGGWGAGSQAVQDQNHAWFKEFYPNMEFVPAPGGGWSSYWEQIVTLLATGDHPDSAMIHFTRTAPFADKGFMQPIDDFIDALPPLDWPDDFHFTAVDNIAYKGKQYGFPIDWAPRAILINRDIMDPILGQWPPPEDWTYRDLLDLAIAATDTSGETKQYGLATGHHAIRQWNVTRGFGGHFFNEEITEGRFTEPEVEEAFQYTFDIMHTHQVSPSAADTEIFGGQFSAFAAGNIGMWWTLSDETRSMVEAVGDSFTLGIGPEPLGPNGRFGFEGNVGWFIPSGSNHPEIAYEFMRWILTDPDQAEFMSVAGFGGFPGRKSAGKWNVLQIEEFLPNYGRAAWELGAESEEHFPLFPEGQEWMPVYNQHVDPLMLEGTGTVKETLANLQADTDQLFANSVRNL